MLTNPQLRSQVDQLWDKLWTGGLSNPLDAIEQLSYLLFLKRIDDVEDRKERQAKRRGQLYMPAMPLELRWKHWTGMQAADALDHLKNEVFPWFKELGEKGSSFERYMQNAECKINKPNLLIETCNLIDHMRISQQAQDVQGDVYEYLLSYLNSAGRSGQFRTPRHIIRMMVQMIAPRPGERIGDLAAPAPAAFSSMPTSSSWSSTRPPTSSPTTNRAGPTTSPAAHSPPPSASSCRRRPFAATTTTLA